MKLRIKAMGLVVAVTTVVTAWCGGGGSATATVPNDVPSVLAKLEKQSVIPVLNRDNTIAGVVTSPNNIRDDINTYIAALSDSAVQKKALVQLASAYQNTMLVDTTNSTALQATDAALVNSISCIHGQYDSTASTQKTLMLEKLTVNTKARFTAYEAFNSALTGSVTDLPAAGVGCAN